MGRRDEDSGGVVRMASGSAYNQRGPEKSVMEPSRRVVLTDIVKGVRPEEPAPDGRVAVRRD